MPTCISSRRDLISGRPLIDSCLTTLSGLSQHGLNAERLIEPARTISIWSSPWGVEELRPTAILEAKSSERPLLLKLGDLMISTGGNISNSKRLPKRSVYY